jgi:hypothetical protein
MPQEFLVVTIKLLMNRCLVRDEAAGVARVFDLRDVVGFPSMCCRGTEVSRIAIS